MGPHAEQQGAGEVCLGAGAWQGERVQHTEGVCQELATSVKPTTSRSNQQLKGVCQGRFDCMIHMNKLLGRET